MSKWNEQMDEKLLSLCMEDVPNAEIAKELDKPVADIYARRSQLGITRDKIAAMKGENNEVPSKIKCAVCGSDKADEVYTMPNGEDKTFCRKCAMVIDFINDHA